MTKAEHVRWCKNRAREEFKYYKEKEGLDAAIRNGMISMASDLRKHSEILGMTNMAVMMGLTIRTESEFNKFVDGFAE